ncbi:hypothetical protein GJAV_G00269450 [Gymnothorax javanicus]|nr:hypothetical protein GJAV_G00269450 [Gymnothorax javanicus]
MYFPLLLAMGAATDKYFAQHVRGVTAPVKLPAPSFGRLVASRGQLGAPIYRSTTAFLVTGPHLRSPDLSYNELHDPHLRDYFSQPARRKQLKKANFITEDNEVICSLRQYNAQEEYLRDLKLLADRQFDELWEEKIELMVDLQKRGLIPEDVTINDMINHVLEKRTKDLRVLLKKDAAKKRRAETGKDEPSDEDVAIEMALLNWRAEVRRRLAPFEKQFRHQRNRERHYQALQEERERKRDASTERRRATWERRMWEKVEKSEKDALKDRKMVPQQETVLDFLEELCDPSELSEEEEDTDRQTAGLSGFFQRRAPAPQKSLTDQAKSPERGETSQDEEMDESRAKRQSGSVTLEPQVMVPQRPKTDEPAHRPRAARVFKLKPAEADQRQAPAPRQSANDPGKFPEKGKTSLEMKIDGSTVKYQSGNIKQPTPPKLQVLLPQRPNMDAAVLRPRTARPCQLKPAQANQELPPIPQKSANDRGSTGTPQSGSMSKPAPARPGVVLPNKPRSGVERIYGLKSADAYKKLPPIHLKSANDVGWYPEKAKIIWEREIQGFIDKVQTRKPREPTVLLPNRPKLVHRSSVERIYGLKSSDAYKNLPWQRKATTTTPSLSRTRRG